MWDREDSQEVGLEAAILERVRNSSLVEWFRADNVAGLSTPPKPWQIQSSLWWLVWVGERPACGEAVL